ncbi:ABC transporter permease [Georgenia sp. Z1344]|uniref:ABC transporter permease n=1 Tax=Georgenia sp. Z1344 TaxID=3416706 RepID=UPI003CEE8365
MTVRAIVLLREAWAWARAERIGSILTVVLVAGLCLSVLMTSGRTVGVEQQVLATIDAAGTRTIVVRAEPEAAVTSDAVERIAAIGTVEQVVGFGPAQDVRSATITGGPAVASRTVHASDLSDILGHRADAVPGSILLTGRGAQTLGLADGVGPVTTANGTIAAVVGTVDRPEFLDALGSTAYVVTDEPGPLAIVVVIADAVDAVDQLVPVVQAALMTQQPGSVNVTTSEAFAQVQAVIGGQLGGFGRSLVLGILLALGVLVAGLQYGVVMIRRKDFGRRRALGASRRLIVGLLLLRTMLCAGVGALLGATTGLGVTRALGDPAPGLSFVVALMVLAIAVCVVGAIAPAIVASRREPLVELRVP